VAVYVDKTRNQYGRMKMCHMLSDSLEELHAMAARIGMKREWFQPLSTPHYDVCLARRKLAIQYGAIEIDRRQTVEIIRRLRAIREG
jgi:hypothetical protein